jgi:tripartite-type tricarboxylate transporter receptor subunit TctC
MRCAVPHRVVALAFALVASTIAHAQEFPSRTITIVSPYQAGGTSDITARILAQKRSARWGKTVIVENRPGANGGIGVSAVAHAAPDGHTLLAVASSALFYPKAGFRGSKRGGRSNLIGQSIARPIIEFYPNDYLA